MTPARAPHSCVTLRRCADRSGRRGPEVRLRRKSLCCACLVARLSARLLGLAALALACLFATASVRTSTLAARAVALAGVAAVLVLGWALLKGVRALVAPAVGLLAFAAPGGNDSLALVPLEAGTLVAIALLAWWSIDESHAGVREPGGDRGRFLTSVALVVTGSSLSVLVVSMASVASASLVAPVVGAVGVVSIAAVLWSTARLRRYEAEHGGDRVS